MAGPLDRFNCKVFAEHLHTTFKIHRDDGAPLLLELTAVKEGEASPKVEMFALHFLGPQTPRLNQAIHRFEHDKLGTFELFLTAIGASPAGILYEVVFNLMRKDQA